MKKFLRKLQGRWRLWWGLCPYCDSHPLLYTCPVCGYYHPDDPFWMDDEGRQRGHPPATWWQRFLDQLGKEP